MLPMIADGDMLGAEQPVHLVLLDLPFAAQALQGVMMEIEDSRFPLVKSVETTTQVAEAARDLDYCILLSSFPESSEADPEERAKQRMEANIGIFKVWGEALNRFARKTCKVLVVGPPAMTNALIVGEFAPTIPRRNITALSRLPHNCAQSLIAQKLNVNVGNIHNVIIWGNHIGGLLPDIAHAEVRGRGSVKELLPDRRWADEELVETVRSRADEVVGGRKNAPAFSVARAACQHMRDWETGTPVGTYVSMGVYTSNGVYGLPDGLMFSLPCACEGDGEWRVVSNLVVHEMMRRKIRACETEPEQDRDRLDEFLLTVDKKPGRPLSAIAQKNPSPEEKESMQARRDAEFEARMAR